MFGGVSCLTVIGAPLPPTAFSWPEARLTPAREAPAMVTEQFYALLGEKCKDTF